jgi:hypothetical protein
LLFFVHLKNRQNMKIAKLTVFLLLAGSMSVTTSCKKKGCMDADAVNYSEKAKKDDGTCNFKPVITIVGANPATVSVSATYNDQGATAFVKNAGAVEVTTDLTQVNTSTTGSFTVTYSAANENGTTTATRLVNVVLGQSSYMGNYTVENTCDALDFPHVSAPQIVAGANANQVLINDAFTALGGTIVMNINGSNVAVPATSIPIVVLGQSVGTLDFSGSGTMNATGTQIVMTYNWSRTGLITGNGVCTVTYNK